MEVPNTTDTLQLDAYSSQDDCQRVEEIKNLLRTLVPKKDQAKLAAIKVNNPEEMHLVVERLLSVAESAEPETERDSIKK